MKLNLKSSAPSFHRKDLKDMESRKNKKTLKKSVKTSKQEVTKTHARNRRVSKKAKVDKKSKTESKNLGKKSKKVAGRDASKGPPLKVSKEDYRKKLNKLHSKLLLEHRNPEATRVTIKTLLDNIGTDNYCVLSNKKTSSRILQTCLKYGDANVRNLIFKGVRNNFSLADLNSNSSKFFMKLYRYCNVDVKLYLRSVFFSDKNKRLLFLRYGSDVMDVIYSGLKSREQLEVLRLYAISNAFLIDINLVKQISNASSLDQFASIVATSEAKDSCREKLESVISKLVDKELLLSAISHDLLYVHLRLVEDKGELISLIYKIFGQLLSTRNGNHVMCVLYEYADAKIQKFIVKRLKTDFPEAVYNQINVTFLIKVISCTEDTKLAIENLLKQVEVNLERLLFDKCAHKFVLAILDPREPARYPTSIKDEKIRQTELQNALLPRLLEHFKGCDLRAAIEDKFASLVLLSTLRLSKDTQLISRILDIFSSNIGYGEGYPKILDSLGYLRFLQAMVKPSKKLGAALNDLNVYEKVWLMLKNKIDDLVSTKGIFLLIDVLEAATKATDTKVINDMKCCITADKIAKSREALRKENVKHVGLDIIESLLIKCT